METTVYEKSDADPGTRTSRPTSGGEHGPFIERVDALRKGRGMRAYGRVLGVSESAIRRLYDGGETTRPVLLAMADEGGATLDWLIAGRGPGPSDSVAEDRASYIAANEADFVSIPRYNVEVAAGHGALVEEEQPLPPLQFRRDWIVQEGWRIKDLVLVTGRGDSLPGLVDDGRPVLVDRSQTSVASDGVYVARLDGHLIVKLMQRGPAGRIYLRSTNPDFREIELRPEDQTDFEVIGRAVWSDRRL